MYRLIVSQNFSALVCGKGRSSFSKFAGRKCRVILQGMKFENGPCEEAEVCLFLSFTSSALDWKHLRVNVALFCKALLKFG